MAWSAGDRVDVCFVEVVEPIPPATEPKEIVHRETYRRGTITTVVPDHQITVHFDSGVNQAFPLPTNNVFLAPLGS